MSEFIVECNNTGAGMCFIDRLIRCKDCKYWQALKESEYIGICEFELLHGYFSFSEGYCSNAIKRDTIQPAASSEQEG